ncbi:putative geraniol 8-hydroxylase [Iris pallida]|uniref:Geraniol 8-hydroxylase n=1 Tax=Iris pallida TaxID=29817 RepID=A0AAX6HS96_IRIPA|nr:putative geraniol 8-hydroxylase [Iris pallida]
MYITILFQIFVFNLHDIYWFLTRIKLRMVLLDNLAGSSIPLPSNSNNISSKSFLCIPMPSW